MEKKLPGRRGQAERNNTVILDAARDVFLADPAAPIAAVVERAGVGFSAVYRRYPRKEDLLRKLCADGLHVFIEAAEASLSESDSWLGLTTFLGRIVEADVHSLTVHLGGTFTPTPEMGQDALRANGLLVELVRRAQASGRLRHDIVVSDVGLVLDGCAGIKLPDAARTSELRRRFLAVCLAGLSSDGEAALPGPAPNDEELNWRWRQR
jgi:AcrR family transcriptional regulator